MKKITIIAGSTNRLLDKLMEEISRENFYIHKIQQNNISARNRLEIWMKLFLLGLKDFIKIIKSKPEISAYHFFGVRSLFSAAILAATKKLYVIHFWGSDYFYWKSRTNFLLRFALRNAKCVTFSNDEMIKDAKKTFGGNIKFEKLVFGLEAIDFIDEYPTKKKQTEIIVVVGTNSQAGQQHLKIIEALEEMDETTRSRFMFIFPLNYGDKTNKEKVKARLSNTNLNYKIIEDYLSGKNLAKFRKDTDILIQAQKTDAMSGAMLECLYAGAKIITGSWLPYDELRKLGIEWTEIDDIKEITTTLPSIHQKYINTDKNKNIVSEFARWSNLTPKWVKCYSQ